MDNSIAERLLEAIQRKKLSYYEIEKLTAIPKSAIQRYATGETSKIPLSRLEVLAKILDVTPAYLMGWEENVVAPNGFDLPSYRRVPILGNIACGTPITAEQNVEGYVDIHDGTHCDFILRCKGSSMEPLLHDNDLVMIRQQPDVEDGQIAAVMVDGEATLKHVYHLPNRAGVQLIAENHSYPPLFYTEENSDSLQIIGLAVAFQRNIV